MELSFANNRLQRHAKIIINQIQVGGVFLVWK